MRRQRRPTEASIRAEERRKRDDEAVRLKAEVPHLFELSLELEERQGEGSNLVGRHIKHVSVQHAPARFEIPCGDTSCKDGGHDITGPVLRALKASQVSVSGEDNCNGYLGSGSCRRVLHFLVHAKYSE
jgi:hypothetical protein